MKQISSCISHPQKFVLSKYIQFHIYIYIYIYITCNAILLNNNKIIITYYNNIDLET